MSRCVPMPLVFMYGPDTLQGRMFDRIGPSTVRGPAILGGFRLAFDKPNMKDAREGLPNLAEADDGEAFGLVFDLSGKQLEQLDGFFGGYEQRRVRPQILPPPPEEGEAAKDPEPVGAVAWIARRTKRGLQPGFSSFEATAEGLEENGAPERFQTQLKEFEPLPSENVEIMVKFERGMPEDDARTLMGAAGGSIRRRMRTDHEDEVMLLVRIPRDRVEVVERDLGKHPKVTLVERNEGGFGIL
ncbi:MAG: gamma-glutamylcyclotransferase family protein [Myxococcota bacterium]